VCIAVISNGRPFMPSFMKIGPNWNGLANIPITTMANSKSQLFFRDGKWGTTRNGQCFQTLPQLEHIHEILVWNTVVAIMHHYLWRACVKCVFIIVALRMFKWRLSNFHARLNIFSGLRHICKSFSVIITRIVKHFYLAEHICRLKQFSKLLHAAI
jgi:hypothetical protein